MSIRSEYTANLDLCTSPSRVTVRQASPCICRKNATQRVSIPAPVVLLAFTLVTLIFKVLS